MRAITNTTAFDIIVGMMAVNFLQMAHKEQLSKVSDADPTQT